MELLGNSTFNFVRNFKMIFQSGCYLNFYTHDTFQVRKKNQNVFF